MCRRSFINAWSRSLTRCGTTSGWPWASPTRSLVLALSALQVWAVMKGRDFVSLKDVKALAAPLFCHRLDLVPGGRSAEEVVSECVAPVVEAHPKTLKG